MTHSKEGLIQIKWVQICKYKYANTNIKIPVCVLENVMATFNAFIVSDMSPQDISIALPSTSTTLDIIYKHEFHYEESKD